jgi:hypothetical protein
VNHFWKYFFIYCEKEVPNGILVGDTVGHTNGDVHKQPLSKRQKENIEKALIIDRGFFPKRSQI